MFFSVVGNDGVFLRASLFPENQWRLMGIYTKLAVSLDHLGIVREVIDGARHSRFDYIALIFALIDNWAQKVEEIHASSRVNVEPEPEQGKEVKGKDLIKCWAQTANL